jgi:hypothetical protein
LLVIGERKSFREIVEIVEIARKSNAIMIGMLSELKRGDLALKMQEIKVLEKSSDEIAFRLKAHITNGAVNPTVIDNLLNCVEVADSVVDDYYIASRELWRMVNIEFDRSLGDRVLDLDTALVKMLENADYAFSILERLLKAVASTEIMQLRQEIERVEEESDNVKDNAFDKLYCLAPTMHYLRFIHYTELLHRFDDIVDGCEDLSDLIVSVMVSISR